MLKYPLSHISNSWKRDRLTHTLSLLDPVFWLLWGPLGSKPKFDPPVTTACIWPNACPNFVPLSTVVPEILRLKGGCDLIAPLSFIISIDISCYIKQNLIFKLDTFSNVIMLFYILFGYFFEVYNFFNPIIFFRLQQLWLPFNGFSWDQHLYSDFKQQ